MRYTLKKFADEYSSDYQVYDIQLLECTHNFNWISQREDLISGMYHEKEVTQLYNQIKRGAFSDELSPIAQEVQKRIKEAESEEAERNQKWLRIHKQNTVVQIIILIIGMILIGYFLA